jgi:ATP-dependent Clp protease ATP-binding subunit ClpC
MRTERNDRRPPLERLVAMGAIDLTARAQAGQLARAFGREAELARIARSLLDKQSVLLLGEAEVGKTAIVHELVNRTVWRQGPDSLHGKRVLAISTGTILAGTEYLGDWQTKLTDVLEAVKQAAGDILLYVEDIWGIRDAGRATDKADGFATLIRPYLERRDVTLIGETTPENYASGPHRQRGLADEPSLLKCFTIVRVEATDAPATRGILQSVARQLQRVHKVRIEAAAIERSLELTRRYLPYQALPGKAVRLLDETAKALADEERERGEPQKPGDGAVVTADRVVAGFSRITGLPEKIISDRIPLTQEEIRAYFEERIIGQEEAIAAVVNVVTLVKAELHDPNHPLGVLFFVGPTGVGKTEMAKTLAEYLFGSKEKLLRFDMSEYKTFSSLDDLLAQLTEKQRRQSFSVLLLDEIEKAGPFVFDLFLAAFDDARLTDGSGRSVDLHNTIIIMTSNLGSEMATSRPAGGMGFIDRRDEEEDPARRRSEALIEVVRSHFRPEFVNRLDKIVAFQPLGVDAMRRIARRELGRALLREGVLRRNILLDFREEVLDVLLAAGFSPTYGARPLQRAIKEEVLLPLARKIAAQPAAGEQLLELCVRDGRIRAEAIPLGPAGEAQRPEAEREQPRGRPAVSGAKSGRERSMDLRRLEVEIEQLRQQVEAHIASDRFVTLRAAAHRLLENMGQPTFWDDQGRSRQTLSTIYRLEQVTDRFADLRTRTEGLAEIANMMRVHGDAAGLRELGETLAALERDLTLAELELMAGDGDVLPVDAAFVCITPLVMPRAHEANDWAEALLAMYASWARRKGYEAETISKEGGSLTLVVRGPSVHRVLAGEGGVHKLQRDADTGAGGRTREGRPAAPRIQLARVEVLPAARPGGDAAGLAGDEVTLAVVEETGDRDARDGARQVVEATDRLSGLSVRVQAQDAEQLALALLAARREQRSRGSGMTADDALARVYYLARSQHVRDPRTGHRDGRPRDVLAGAIDPFLVAYLSQHPDAGCDRPKDATAGDAAK